MAAELSKSENCLNVKHKLADYVDREDDDMTPPPVPPLPVNYQRSDGMFVMYNVHNVHCVHATYLISFQTFNFRKTIFNSI